MTWRDEACRGRAAARACLVRLLSLLRLVRVGGGLSAWCAQSASQSTVSVASPRSQHCVVMGRASLDALLAIAVVALVPHRGAALAVRAPALSRPTTCAFEPGVDVRRIAASGDDDLSKPAGGVPLWTSRPGALVLGEDGGGDAAHDAAAAAAPPRRENVRAVDGAFVLREVLSKSECEA